MALKTIKPKHIKHLLIRSTNWIGDAIMTTPAIRAIRKGFPNARISILVKPWVAPVFENSPHIDNLIIYDGDGRHKGNVGKLRLARDLRRYGFDAAILLQNAFEAALIAFLSGIPVRIGYNTDARQMMLTHAISCTNKIKKEHQTKYYLNILSGIGMDTGSRDLYLQLSQQDRLRAGKILMDQGITGDFKWVGINPGATFGPAKQWPIDRYAHLADLISEYTNARVIVFGGPQDERLGKDISREMRHRPIDLSGRTTLGEAMALIERCHLFISNDSGLMHVAAALDAPLIAIFGSTNSTTTGPMSSNSRVVQIPMECSPCLKPECPRGHLNCMDQISVDMIFDVVKEIL